MSLNPVPNDSFPIASVDEIIMEAKAGRMFILTDDEDRENEGDLIVAAQFATPEAINFMAHFGCGLICLPMAPELVERLRLPMMTENNGSRFGTPFTLSIEAREGVTTGISAADRAHTIRTAVDPRKSAKDIVSPGHVFPLKAHPNGVLARRGQTEGSVDIMRLSGLTPAAVLCEIMKDDGTMARMPDIVSFARAHDMKIGTIADLADYRRGLETSEKVAIR
jgi:3,4-dihydroxy 2-butanone 4-phosphate synthase/GTP cyclohydrolase II